MTRRRLTSITPRETFNLANATPEHTFPFRHPPPSVLYIYSCRPNPCLITHLDILLPFHRLKYPPTKPADATRRLRIFPLVWKNSRVSWVIPPWLLRLPIEPALLPSLLSPSARTSKARVLFFPGSPLEGPPVFAAAVLEMGTVLDWNFRGRFSSIGGFFFLLLCEHSRRAEEECQIN